MPVYEFQCPKGHLTSELVPMGTTELVCEQCSKTGPWPPEMAARVLSATPTTFKFADRRDKS